MNSDKSVGLQLFCDRGNRLSQQIGPRIPLEQDVISLRLHHGYVAWVDQKNPPVALDCNLDSEAGGVLMCHCLQMWQKLNQLCRTLARCSTGGKVQGLIHAFL